MKFNILEEIYSLFVKRYYNINIPNMRPAFIRYIDGYYPISLNSNRLIINLKKEVQLMNAKQLVLAQLDALNKEKQEIVNKVIEAEKENIEILKAKAAEEAEALYRKEVETKVADQYRIAENHLVKLLESLPDEETADIESNIDPEEVSKEESTDEEKPLI